MQQPSGSFSIAPPGTTLKKRYHLYIIYIYIYKHIYIYILLCVYIYMYITNIYIYKLCIHSYVLLYILLYYIYISLYIYYIYICIILYYYRYTHTSRFWFNSHIIDYQDYHRFANIHSFRGTSFLHAWFSTSMFTIFVWDQLVVSLHPPTGQVVLQNCSDWRKMVPANPTAILGYPILIKFKSWCDMLQ